MQPLNEIITITIHGLGSSGEGIGYLEGYTLFVEGALPGEVVDIKMIERHSRYGRGELVALKKSSPSRVKPSCPLFGKCGGCQLMHLDYPEQLKIKEQRVIDALERIGKLKNLPVEPCIASPSPLAYRNKIQLPIREEKKGLILGLYAKSSHKLIEVNECLIHCSLGESIYRQIAPLIKASQVGAYSPLTGKGQLRHLFIKSALHTEEVLVILVTNSAVSAEIAQLAKAIKTSSSAIKGVIHNKNSSRDNVILGKHYSILEGEGYIEEKLLGLTFKVSPAAFFQVNPLQAESLYTSVMQFARLTGSERVLDAYCGVGTISLILAKKAKQVVGIESVPEAIVDAQENATRNQIDNVSFICDQAERYIDQLEAIDVVVVNPPRKGCESSFIRGLQKLLPKRIIYISCDPATLARDLALIVAFGYSIEKVQPFDMFPQTSHVETCVLLTLTAE